MKGAPRRRPLLSRFRDFIYGRREAPTPDLYEPPVDAEPYDAKGDDVPWELRDD